MNTESGVAEAVGKKILGLKGSALIKMLYFLEERNTLEMLRAYAALSYDNQTKVLDFLKETSRRDDVTLNISRAGIEVRPGG